MREIISREQEFLLPLSHGLICIPVEFLQIGIHPLEGEQAEVDGTGVRIIFLILRSGFRLGMCILHRIYRLRLIGVVEQLTELQCVCTHRRTAASISIGQ